MQISRLKHTDKVTIHYFDTFKKAKTKKTLTVFSDLSQCFNKEKDA